MSMRLDFVHDTEKRLQQEALSMLRARKSAQAVLDREAAAKDVQAKWVRDQVAASRPAPQAGLQQAARAGMISRSIGRPWTPEPAVNPVQHAAAMRMDGASAPAGVRSAAGARALMMRRLGER